jgi:hypothetical protein
MSLLLQGMELVKLRLQVTDSMQLLLKRGGEGFPMLNLIGRDYTAA